MSDLIGVCTVNGCGAYEVRRGMCWTHLRAAVDRWKKTQAGRCVLDGCDGPVRARGLCRLHYVRWWRHGDPRHVERVATAAPVNDGCRECGRPVVALGWCQSHYVELRDTEGCAVEGCDRNVLARGWCRMHYQRVRRNGAPGPAEALPAKPRRKRTGCLVDGCEEPHRARGYCASHYKAARRGRLGDPIPVLQRQREARP